MTGRAIDDATLAVIRAQLPAIHGPAYLNAGTMGPMPLSAIAAMDAERDYDERTRQTVDHWDRLTDLQHRARTAITRLTGVADEQVALMHTTHEALNSCLWGLDLRPGQSVVTTDEEHPGLLVPLRHVRARLGVEVQIARWCDGDEQFVDAVLAQVGSTTRAVALSHVSWTSGRIAPLRMLREALPDGVRLIIDGAQSAGVLQVDPADGWDAYTVSGQKWPCGPNGSGGLAMCDPEAWLPTFGAYTQVTDFDDILGSDVVAEGRRLEQSQEALGPLAGLAASVHWLVDEVGLQAVHEHARAMNARARAALQATGVDPASLHGHDHLLAIDTPAGRAAAIAEQLVQDGVMVRPLGDSRLRASFGCWNTRAEIDLLCDRLAPHLG
jgi:L-cysteine/cystine lyase